MKKSKIQKQFVISRFRYDFYITVYEPNNETQKVIAICEGWEKHKGVAICNLKEDNFSLGYGLNLSIYRSLRSIYGEFINNINKRLETTKTQIDDIKNTIEKRLEKIYNEKVKK